MISTSRMKRFAECFSLGVLFCVSVIILTGCPAKPIKQDLPQASVEPAIDIKYLDAVGVDQVDDIRKKRLEFYEKALADRPTLYTQGVQGGIDRVSTFAAAIGVNAQTDEGVLERYQASTDYGTQAIQNNAELLESRIDHEKEVIANTNEINKAKVEAEIAITKAKAEAFATQITYLKKRLEELDSQAQDLTGEELTAVRAQQEELIKQLQTLTNISTTQELKTQVNSVEIVEEDGDNSEAAKKTVVNLSSQHPQVDAVQNSDLLEKFGNDLSSINTGLDKLLSERADGAGAQTKTAAFKSPPIERIRNDEAVVDYLLDGMRNSQLVSTTMYGGMTQRVLPFMFTFSPYKNTKSGYAARVILKPDPSQMHLIQKTALPYLKEIARQHQSALKFAYNYTSIKYKNSFQGSLLEKMMRLTKKGGLTETTIEAEQQQIYSDFSHILRIKSEPLKVDGQEFWRAYAIALKLVTNGIEKNIKNIGEKEASVTPQSMPEDSGYQLVADMDIYENILTQIKEFTGIQTETSKSSIMDLKLPRYMNFKADAWEQSLRLSEKVKSWSNEQWPNNNNISFFWADIDRLVGTICANILFHESFLIPNPLWPPPVKRTYKEKGVVDNVLSSDGKPLFLERGSIELRYDSAGGDYPATLPDPDEQIVATSIRKALFRLVQNTSREQVVELADTNTINTLMKAAVDLNKVSSSLGVNIGAEIAAAVSSSTAFIKRIPYAAPFSGVVNDDKKDGGQAYFGWRFYKVPVGAKADGAIEQAFKTTVLNSSVVVTIPEWMTGLEAVYQHFYDGEWQEVSREHIALPGAGLAGLDIRRDSSTFHAWVHYYLMNELDMNSSDFPSIHSCDSADRNTLYAVPGEQIAVCGSNLHGVKGLIFGGHYIEKVQRVSNNLLIFDSAPVKDHACWKKEEGPKNGGEQGGGQEYVRDSRQCSLLPLSDFGGQENTKALQVVWVKPDDNRPGDSQTLPDIFAADDVQLKKPTQSGENIEIEFSGYNIHGALKTEKFILDPMGDEGIVTGEKVTQKDNTWTYTAGKNDILNYCKRTPRSHCSVTLKVKETGVPERALTKVSFDKSIFDPFPNPTHKNPRIEPVFDSTNKFTNKYKFKIFISDYSHSFKTPRLRLNSSSIAPELTRLTEGDSRTFEANISVEDLKSVCNGWPGKIPTCKIEAIVEYPEIGDAIFPLNSAVFASIPPSGE